MKTDAILLSYYLEKTCGWTYQKKAPRTPDIRADESKGESSNWYSNGNDNLLICAVGGKYNFGKFFGDKIYNPMIQSNAFSRIAVITDRDNRDEQAIIGTLLISLKSIIACITNDIWVPNTYEDSFKQHESVDFLLVIIPPDKEGALENLLLETISENEYDKAIVSQCIDYVNRIQPMASNYIHKNRLKLKATLGVTWAIQSPEKVFSFFNEQIRSVKWEDSQVLARCIKQLHDI